MIRPRLGILPVMGLVALIAGDLAIYRNSHESIYVKRSDFDALCYCVLGVLPVSTAAAFSALLMVPRLMRRGEGGSFLSGCLLFGLIAALAFTILLSLAMVPIADFVNDLIFEVMYPRSPYPGTHLRLILWMGLVSPPQLAIAASGGFLFRRLDQFPFDSGG